MSLSAAQQYTLKLINRARLNAGLSARTTDTTAKQVLAPNSILDEAVTDTSLWMLETNNFS
jgi:serralysin